MSIERLADEIKKFSPNERKQLFKLLGITLPEKDQLRGGPDDPLEN